MTSKTKTAFGQCRCCLANGHHRDLMKEYWKNDSREVYCEIFAECYNLYLSTKSQLSTLICSTCISRLREASEFRTMVVENEQKLLASLCDMDTDTDFVNMPVNEHVLDPVKEEFEVKEEPSHDNDDYLDFDSKREYHEEFVGDTEDDTGLVPGEAELLARFTNAPALPARAALDTICPIYATQLDLLKNKVILPKHIQKLLEDTKQTTTPQKKNTPQKRVCATDKLALIVNATALIEFSNLTPFKSKTLTGYPCFYCKNILENLAKLREHQTSHSKSEVKIVLGTYCSENLVVYADVTDLTCTICNNKIPSLNELKSHLTHKHKKKMYPEFGDRVIPFKLSDDSVFVCQVCGIRFETFGSIERHMNKHFRNYVCELCGTGFVTNYRLKVHVKGSHVEGSFPCSVCKKEFSTHQKLQNHISYIHKSVKRFKCPKCPERFKEYIWRQKHMTMVHDVARLRYTCNVCERSFTRRFTLSSHMKRDHLEERDYQCELCLYKCFKKEELRRHMVKHNGERIFECSVCKKSYARKKTLKEHMRIHNNDRRFVCPVCGQAFVQKCSLKGHLKTHDVDYNFEGAYAVK